MLLIVTQNIQSTNWQTMRFKPPPPNSPIGWRVEFRPCEVQLTDFENAAIVCFVVLLTRAILSYQLNFIIPISKVIYILNSYKVDLKMLFQFKRVNGRVFKWGGKILMKFWSSNLRLNVILSQESQRQGIENAPEPYHVLRTSPRSVSLLFICTLFSRSQGLCPTAMNTQLLEHKRNSSGEKSASFRVKNQEKTLVPLLAAVDLIFTVH